MRTLKHITEINPNNIYIKDYIRIMESSKRYAVVTSEEVHLTNDYKRLINSKYKFDLVGDINIFELR